jgi:16S rRNA U516 pseudouridylate synthase RsuA-like enzyme
MTDATTRIVALNKPRGVLTAKRRDPTSPELPTVIELLLLSGLADAECFSHVGRLDVASEGLLLLTTDGQLTARMIDPAHGCRKTYLAVARGRGRPGSRARIHAGGRTRALTHARTHGANTAPALQPATPSDQARAPRACARACFFTLTRRRPTWQG